jgi:hypothetical protein
MARSFSARMKRKAANLDALDHFDPADIAVPAAALTRIGFQRVEDVETSALLLDTTTYARIYRLDDPPCWAAIYVLAKIRRRVLRPARAWVVFHTFLHDGALVTGDLPWLRPGHADLPQGVVVQRGRAGAPLALWGRHEALVQAALARGARLRPVPAGELFDRIAATEPLNREEYDFVPMDGKLTSDIRRFLRRLLGR